MLQSKPTVLLALAQQTNELGYWDENEDPDGKLRMDEYMELKMAQSVDDSPQCTTSCVAECGMLAELPRTQASQLVGCFEETCGCRNKWRGSIPADQTEAELMRQYFDLIHNQERVEYLLLQQSVVE